MANEKILVVDDSPTDLRLMTASLPWTVKKPWMLPCESDLI
jgi:hypothetical protein